VSKEDARRKGDVWGGMICFQLTLMENKKKRYHSFKAYSFFSHSFIRSVYLTPNNHHDQFKELVHPSPEGEGRMEHTGSEDDGWG